MKKNFIFIPLATLAVSVIGGRFTSSGISSGWYDSISKPLWTPPGSFIGIVWTIIFILTAISAVIVWNKFPHGERFYWTAGMFIVNAVLNMLWSYLFFVMNFMGLAAVEAGMLGGSVIVLFFLIWPVSRLSALLLLPYAVWVSFATYLNYTIYALNI